jgi:hypothetical protein
MNPFKVPGSKFKVRDFLSIGVPSPIPMGEGKGEGSFSAKREAVLVNFGRITAEFVRP